MSQIDEKLKLDSSILFPPIVIVDTTNAVLTTLPKNFLPISEKILAQCPKLRRNNFFIYKKFVWSKYYSGREDCSFEGLAGRFMTEMREHFLVMTEIDEKFVFLLQNFCFPQINFLDTKNAILRTSMEQKSQKAENYHLKVKKLWNKDLFLKRFLLTIVPVDGLNAVSSNAVKKFAERPKILGPINDVVKKEKFVIQKILPQTVLCTSGTQFLQPSQKTIRHRSENVSFRVLKLESFFVRRKRLNKTFLLGS